MNLRKLSFFILLLVGSAAAQFTTVSGTVTDPNGLPYAKGTITPTLVLPGGTSPTLNGFAYSPPTQPVGLDLAGSFTMRLGDNTVLQPSLTQWTFLVCSALGTVQPAEGTGPNCFTAGPLTISGASQSITTQLLAAAALTTPASKPSLPQLQYPETYTSFVPGSLTAQTCSTNTFILTGARMNADFVVPMWPTGLPANVAALMRVSASDTVEIRMCNPTASTITFGSTLTFGAKLFR